VTFHQMERIVWMPDALTKLLSIQVLGDRAVMDHRDTGSLID